MQIAHKKDVPSELTVEIEKLSNLGYGIAKYDGYVIFVENACPGDTVKIRLTKKNKSYANAVILEIINPSPHRITPFCPMQKVCGACQLQFIDYNYQLELKKHLSVVGRYSSLLHQEFDLQHFTLVSFFLNDSSECRVVSSDDLLLDDASRR